MGKDKERSNCARVGEEVPLPPGWEWAMRTLLGGGGGIEDNEAGEL